MSEANWIKLDSISREGGEEATMRGVNVKLFVSPNDIPKAIRGFYDKHAACFVIEFTYMMWDEGVTSKEIDEHVSIEAGKHTGRIKKIEIDVDGAGANQVSLELMTRMDKAFKAMDDVPLFKSAQRNRKLVRDAVLEHEREIVGACS